jgi:hypothetical protein
MSNNNNEEKYSFVWIEQTKGSIVVFDKFAVFGGTTPIKKLSIEKYLWNKRDKLLNNTL